MLHNGNRFFWVFFGSIGVCCGIIFMGLKWLLAQPEIPLQNPLDSSPTLRVQLETKAFSDDALTRGQKQYHIRCTRCHGQFGEGTHKAPSFQSITTLPEAEQGPTVFTTIYYGKGQAAGQGMPSWGHKLIVEDIVDLTSFVLYLTQHSKDAQK